ncbi:MAG: hypothetical protein ACFFC7_03680 [Candidatus Hermodarchaeota archaeon]
MKPIPKSPEPQIPLEPQDNKYILCQQPIEKQTEILSCPFCGVEGHPGHFKEWIRIKQACPNCRQGLLEEKLISGILEVINECWVCHHGLDSKQPKCGA